MRRSLSRHRAALRRVVARRLRPFLRRRIDPSDVVQEAQIDALNRLADYIERRPMPFRPWLIRTAIERLLKLQRHALTGRRDIGRDQPLCGDAQERASPETMMGGSTPSQECAAREQADRLSTYLEQLPAADRAILRMRAIEGLSYEEAGLQLAIDPAAARSATAGRCFACALWF